MIHFNHDYTAGVPNAVGDRYYAQDLNDDFNYLKHLPYEVLYKGKNGVITLPTYEYDEENKTFTFKGGAGIFNTNCTVIDESVTWTIPPATKSDMRYERVEFKDSIVDVSSYTDSMAYLVVTPTKKNLLTRTKALIATPYEARTKYEGQISITTSEPTANQIFLGLVSSGNIILPSSIQYKKNVVLLDVCDCKTAQFTPTIMGQIIYPIFGSSANRTLYSIECSDMRLGQDDASSTYISGNIKNSVVSSGYVTVNYAENCDFNKCTINVLDSSSKCVNCKIGNISSSSSDSGTFENCQITLTSFGSSLNLKGIFINCNINCRNITVYPEAKLINCNITTTSLIQTDGRSDSTFIGCNIDTTAAPYNTETNDVSLYSTLERCTIQCENNIKLFNYMERHIDSCNIKCYALTIDGTTNETSRIKVSNSYFFTQNGITAIGDYYLNCTFEERYMYSKGISFISSRLDHCTILSFATEQKKTMLEMCYCTHTFLHVNYSGDIQQHIIQGGIFTDSKWVFGDSGNSTQESIIVTSPLVCDTTISSSFIQIMTNVVNTVVIGGIFDTTIRSTTIMIKEYSGNGNNGIVSSFIDSVLDISKINTTGAVFSMAYPVDSYVRIMYGKVGTICPYGAINTTIEIAETTVTSVVGMSATILMPCIGVVVYNINQSTADVNKSFVQTGSNWSTYNIAVKRWLSMDKGARGVVD
ncbi:MAG: hypothetical protein HDQ88_03880 [Clostridia bacterium]|nr:hypothetical protein [Clostridia bacterium]